MSFSTGAQIPKSGISGYKTKQLPNFTPQQMALFNQLLGQLGQSGGGIGQGIDWLSGIAGGDEDAFKDLEEPAFRQLQGTIGGIANRFAGMGGLGSSGFQQMASGAASDLASDLQSKRTGMRQNALQSLLGLSSNLLGQNPYTYMHQEKKGGFNLGGLLGLLGGSLGGPIAGSFGEKAGQGLYNKFFG